MPIEVRQLVIRSTVDSGETGADSGQAADSVEQLRGEILSECRALIEEKLQQIRER